MKKIFLLASLTALFAPSAVYARCEWNINEVTYDVDTLYHATVGPGTTETELTVSAIVNGDKIVNNIFYTVTDLSNPNVEMRAAKAGNHMRMLETVPQIASRMHKPGEHYFAGVNADFFNMGAPYNSIGTCIANGFLTNYFTDGADIDPYYIYFDGKGKPGFARHVVNSWEGVLRFPYGDSYEFHLNTRRAEDEILMYTPQWQLYQSSKVGYTGTNSYGVEVKVRPVGKNVLYGTTLQLEVVEEPESGVGNMAIPVDGYVLSGHGSGATYLAKLKKGDIVTASIGFTADGKPTVVKELLGGFPFILRYGTVQVTPGYPEHLAGPEPRTAVGYNSDATKLVMLVVDGRKAGGSAGVTQRQLAYIMRNVGCTDAMNFDGGGSSTMFVDGLGVKNVPSSSSLDQRPEGQPRTVVNALFAVATAPVDNTIASIEIREKKFELATGESVTPVVYGYNQYGVLIATDLRKCTFSIPEQVASVSGNIITASEGNYSTILTADYNGLTYSVPFYTNGGGEFVTAGIDDVAVDQDSSVDEYYQLNGIKTDAPVRGRVNIVRSGNSARKELH